MVAVVKYAADAHFAMYVQIFRQLRLTDIGLIQSSKIYLQGAIMKK